MHFKTLFAIYRLNWRNIVKYLKLDILYKNVIYIQNVIKIKCIYNSINCYTN